MKKLNENTYLIEDGFVYCYLLIGKEKALLIDTGVSGMKIREEVEQVTDLPLLLLNTHGDGDHVAGNNRFSEFYMHKADYENCGLNGKLSGTLIPVEDGDQIDLGGRMLKIIGIPGHTKGSIAVLDAENRQLFAGDSVQSGQIFMFGPHRRPGQFASSLQKLEELKGEYDTILASHANPVLASDYVQKVAAFWNQIQSGQVSAAQIEMFGNPVDSYEGPSCGFFCNRKK
ncbi:MAG: MBL fold metallo-hydrolase [Clostridiales bacterium]|nr:MBL fold metallo-hydrolase [Candidatus Blautia equi]